MNFLFLFTSHLDDWGIDLSSRLAHNYFLSAIEDRPEIRTMSMDMKFRHPEWDLGKTVW